MSRLRTGAIVAVDLGGTRVRAATFGSRDRIERRLERATPTGQGPDAVVAGLADLVEAVDMDPTGGPAAPAVVVAATGPFDSHGCWIDPSNLGPAFFGYPLARRLADRLARPVLVGLDTRLALLGERRAGALLGVGDAIFITVSTGVGGALLVGDRLVTGAHGIAGEVGHLPVGAGGPRCGCGARGHLEAFACGPALARAGTLVARRGASPWLAARLGAVAPRGLTGEDIATAAAAGDDAARAILDRAARALGQAVTGLANSLDPTRIVLGGAVVLADPERWIDACRVALAHGGQATQRRALDVVCARLGDDAGLVGCLDHARLGVRWVAPRPSAVATKRAR